MSTRLVACPFAAIDGVRGWSVATMTRAWGVSSRCAIAAGAGGFWSASPDVINADRADRADSMIRMAMHYSGILAGRVRVRGRDDAVDEVRQGGAFASAFL